MACLLEQLSALPPLNWEGDTIMKDLHTIFDLVSKDKASLRELILEASKQQELFAQFECHAQFDRFVLYDSLHTQKFRIRLHIWHDNEFDLPHQHRYSFATNILAGGYNHILYSTKEELFENRVTSTDARPYQKGLSGQNQANIRNELIPVKQFQTFHGVGDVYFLGPDILHSSRNTKNNVSLFVRGPAERDRALEMEADTGRLFFRHSRNVESTEQREDVTMKANVFVEHLQKLEQLGVI